MSDQETQMPVPLHAHLPENAPDLLNWVDLQTDDLRVRVLNYGAVTAHCDLWSGAEWVPMILGYQDMQSYLGDPFYLGAIVGRVANRVGAAQMKLGGQVVHLVPNEGQNQLHGGAQGLGRVFWELDQVTARSARLRHVSPHGANGYPGEAEFVVTIALQGRTVTYDLTVTVDRPTPINLAQHNYYTLGHGAGIWDHVLRSDARQYLQLDADGVPTGHICDVEGTRYDFRRGLSFARLDPERRGSDIHVIFADREQGLRDVAQLRAPSDIGLTLRSDQPGAQIYTAGSLESAVTGRGGQKLRPFSALCIEPQGYPDAPNHPHFPSIMVTPESPYQQRLELVFEPGKAGVA